jgi:hypothetical protein
VRACDPLRDGCVDAREVTTINEAGWDRARAQQLRGTATARVSGTHTRVFTTLRCESHPRSGTLS